MHPSANSTPARRSPNRPRRVRVAAALAGLVALVAGAAVLPAPAQVSPTGLSINPIVPPGQTQATLPTGAQIVNVVISNPTPTVLVNQQAVIRVGLPPAYIVTVTDGAAGLGTVDNRTGVWYGLVPVVPANSSVTLTMTWFQPCAGRWPVAARFGDRTSALVLGFVGPTDAKCPLDENASPQPNSYYALAWPPSTTPTTTVPPVPTPTPTVPGATSPPGVIPTVPTGQPTTTGFASTVITTPLTATTTTLLRLGPSTTAPTAALRATTTTNPGRQTTTTVRRTGPTTTTVIICKTVAGRRYCGPSSSAYKPGQAKAIESKPGQKVTVTTKKKSSATTKKKR